MIERLYVTHDQFSPTAVLNRAGEVVERFGYSPFGVPRVMTPDFSERAESSFDWDCGFQGQFVDGESGYLNYGYRYYVAFLGRWASRDPIAEEGGLNLYAFVRNGPTNLVDALGLTVFVEGDVGGVVGVFNFLCPNGKFAADGTKIRTDDCCPVPENPKTSCKCLCEVVLDENRSYTIKLIQEANDPQIVVIEGNQENIPFPSPGPYTIPGQNPVIVMPPINGATFKYGFFDVAGAHHVAPWWDILGHELCGHGWANKGLYQFPQVPGNREGHDSAIDVENEIALEHTSIAARGKFRDPKQGESSWALANENVFYYRQKAGAPPAISYHKL